MDFTNGSITQKIVKFSVPLLIGNILQQIYSISDSIIVGNLLGSDPLAAIGATMPIIQVSIALVIGITSGASVVISQLYGANRINEIKKAVTTSFAFFMVLSLLLSVIGYIITDQLLLWMNVPEEVLPMAAAYLKVIFVGTVFKVGYNLMNSLFRGIGNSQIPLLVLVISTILNVVLDFVFIQFFHLGVEGTAWATIISQLVSFAISFILFQKNNISFKISLKKENYDKALLHSILTIGLPTGLKATLYWGGYAIITSTVNSFGAATVAAFGIASRIDCFVQTPQGSLNSGLASFTGQNIGAGKLDRIRSALKASNFIGISLALATTAAIYLFSSQILSLFTDDEEIIAIGAEYLKTVSLFYVVYSLQEVVQGVAVGSGHTLILMISTIVAMWLVRIPIATILSRHIGAKGVWISIPSGWFVAMLFTNGFYLSGKWKKPKSKTNSK